MAMQNITLKWHNGNTVQINAEHSGQRNTQVNNTIVHFDMLITDVLISERRKI